MPMGINGILCKSTAMGQMVVLSNTNDLHFHREINHLKHRKNLNKLQYISRMYLGSFFKIGLCWRTHSLTASFQCERYAKSSALCVCCCWLFSFPYPSFIRKPYSSIRLLLSSWIAFKIYLHLWSCCQYHFYSVNTKQMALFLPSSSIKCVKMQLRKKTWIDFNRMAEITTSKVGGNSYACD